MTERRAIEAAPTVHPARSIADAPTCHCSNRTAALRLGWRIRAGHGPLLLAAGNAVLLLTIAVPPVPRLVWNASASAPRGLYAVAPHAPVARGDMVIAWAPPGPRALAAARHYLPSNVPLVKRVRAVSGDRVCAIGAHVTVNGVVLAKRQARDSAGRALPWWRGCVTLPGGALFLLMAAPGSFDGRYFGPTRAADVVGKAYPLWVE